MKFRQIPGSALVFLGAFFWSLNAPIVKFLPLNSLLICGLRAILAALALAPFIRPKKLNWNGWMLLYVASYAALCFSIIQALTMTSSPIAIGMQYTATIWLFLLHWYQTKHFDRNRFIPVVIIMVGVVIFMLSGSDSTTNTGNLIALSEGIFFSLMTLSAKKAGKDNPLGLTAVANIFTGVLMCILFPTAMAGTFSLSAFHWIIMIILGVIQVGLGYGCYNAGVIKTSPQTASILALWEMILGPLWVAIFLHEYPTVLVIVGFVIILAGMLLDAVLPSR